MILYNVTVGIDKEIEAVWVEWMKTTHIPEVLKTGTFIKYKFYKVISHDDEGSVSYCIQYFTPTLEKFNLYLKDYAPALMEHHRAKFDGKHVAFLTLLEEV